jgi:predicted AAA+ superfamily ATPase
MNSIDRPALIDSVRTALARSRAVVLSGPRQSGKSTLAQSFLPRSSAHYFDLENPLHESRLSQPMDTLSRLHGLVVIDEVQRRPGLFPMLRVLIDRSDAPGQYLLLGSASAQLLRQSGESLLGRVEVVEVAGFDLGEVAADYLENTSTNASTRTGGRPEMEHVEAAATQLWLRGGFPRAYLAASDADSLAWRASAISSHVEVDLPQLGLGIAAPAMLRFWRMLAHCHGQVWNAAEPARALGVSEPTVRRYLDILTHTLMVRQLQPWHENLGKRQVKAPKIYFRDSGMLHALMGVCTMPELLAHPRCGASWEGFALEQVLRLARPDAAYFGSTHQGAELDLLLLKGDRRIGVEFKRADAPSVTRSMRTALQDLKLERLYVVYPGAHRFALEDRIEAVPLSALLPLQET